MVEGQWLFVHDVKEFANRVMGGGENHPDRELDDGEEFDAS